MSKGLKEDKEKIKILENCAVCLYVFKFKVPKFFSLNKSLLIGEIILGFKRINIFGKTVTLTLYKKTEKELILLIKLEENLILKRSLNSFHSVKKFFFIIFQQVFQAISNKF